VQYQSNDNVAEPSPRAIQNTLPNPNPAEINKTNRTRRILVGMDCVGTEDFRRRWLRDLRGSVLDMEVLLRMIMTLIGEAMLGLRQVAIKLCFHASRQIQTVEDPLFVAITSLRGIRQVVIDCPCMGLGPKIRNALRKEPRKTWTAPPRLIGTEPSFARFPAILRRYNRELQAKPTTSARQRVMLLRRITEERFKRKAKAHRRRECSM